MDPGCVRVNGFDFGHHVFDDRSFRAGRGWLGVMEGFRSARIGTSLCSLLGSNPPGWVVARYHVGVGD